MLRWIARLLLLRILPRRLVPFLSLLALIDIARVARRLLAGDSPLPGMASRRLTTTSAHPPTDPRNWMRRVGRRRPLPGADGSGSTGVAR